MGEGKCQEKAASTAGVSFAFGVEGWLPYLTHSLFLMCDFKSLYSPHLNPVSITFDPSAFVNHSNLITLGVIIPPPFVSLWPSMETTFPTLSSIGLHFKKLFCLQTRKLKGWGGVGMRGIFTSPARGETQPPCPIPKIHKMRARTMMTPN